MPTAPSSFPHPRESLDPQGLKRGQPSDDFSSSNSLSSLSVQSVLRPPKKWRTHEDGTSSSVAAATRVSFGNLNEAVLFDRTGSSRQLGAFKRVQVSELSFGSTASVMQTSGSFRWGEQNVRKNADWAQPTPPSSASPSANARWASQVPTTLRPATQNMLLQSMQPPSMPTPSWVSPTSSRTREESIRFPTRCPSPPPPPPFFSSASPPLPPLQRQQKEEQFDPPRVSFSKTSFITQLPPVLPPRSDSPMSILPEPVVFPNTNDSQKRQEEESAYQEPHSWFPPSAAPFVFGAPPKRPVRRQSMTAQDP